MMCSPPLPPGMLGTIEPTSCGSMLEVIDRIRPAAGQDHQPLDVVAKLADVARPDMRLQHGHGVLADLRRGRPVDCEI